ncbi:hypothetical protein P3S67_015388 [Capsicum chacoense]
MSDNSTVIARRTTVAAATDFTSSSHPYFISPSDSPGTLLVNTPFDGKSFAGWNRRMMIALTAKNTIDFIDGSIIAPTENTDLYKAWSRANNMVISWLLNSLSREISDSVIYSSPTKELWNDLEARFGQSSGAKLFQLQKKLSDLSQGTCDIATYYTKIKRLWDELDVWMPSSCVVVTVPAEQKARISRQRRI